MKTTPPIHNPTQHSDPTSLTGDALLEMVEQLKRQNQVLQRTLDEKSEVINRNSEIIEKKSDVIGAQKKRIAVLEEYLRLARQKQHGPSSEKNVLQTG